MAWFTVIFGGIILIVGLLGQFFGIRKGMSGHPADRRMGRLVFTIGSVVVALWIVAFATARLLQFKTTGHW
ncbi:MAG TPA: hypothetical protein VE178_06455 [Silvibacterium sp.]|nr:hypothetical protein [Silvibacterium sp.]